MGRGFFSSIISFAYLVVGAIIANSHKYFAHVANLKAVVSAALAVISVLLETEWSPRTGRAYRQ
jgi:hypothetical protein